MKIYTVHPYPNRFSVIMKYANEGHYVGEKPTAPDEVYEKFKKEFNEKVVNQVRFCEDVEDILHVLEKNGVLKQKGMIDL